jgi:hypothetical protein
MSKNFMGGRIGSQLTVVEERTSENGFKEDLDRREFELTDQIENLEKRIEDIRGISKLTRTDIEAITK